MEISLFANFTDQKYQKVWQIFTVNKKKTESGNLWLKGTPMQIWKSPYMLVFI